MNGYNLWLGLGLISMRISGVSVFFIGYDTQGTFKGTEGCGVARVTGALEIGEIGDLINRYYIIIGSAAS